jgi:glutamate synthase domain-containing protein 1
MGQSRLTFAKDHDACGVGFIAQLGGPASHAVVERGIGALGRLAHRGGVDADGRSGDGAGLLVGLPKAFFQKGRSL